MMTRPRLLDLFQPSLSQMIPPAYTEHIGRQLLAYLGGITGLSSHACSAASGRLHEAGPAVAETTDGHVQWATRSLGTTASGAPRHPLYLPTETPLVPFDLTKVRP
jgi:hypothetical protein